MSPQSSIAHYKITSKLGEGGMGAVYRATDTKLNRDVAIKVLLLAFAEDAARMARFEREAQVLASLNHPNIAAIYGIEQNAIVMELVEGADRAGPVPIDTAIERRVAYGSVSAGTGDDLWTRPLDLTDPDHPRPGKPEVFLNTPRIERNPAFSPDGRWLAYRSDESGRFELYVRVDRGGNHSFVKEE